MKMGTKLRTRRLFALFVDKGGGEGGVRDRVQRAEASARNDISGSHDCSNVQGNWGSVTECDCTAADSRQRSKELSYLIESCTVGVVSYRIVGIN